MAGGIDHNPISNKLQLLGHNYQTSTLTIHNSHRRIFLFAGTSVETLYPGKCPAMKLGCFTILTEYLASLFSGT